MNIFRTSIIICLVFFSSHTVAIELTECRIGSESGAAKVKAECGVLPVAEDRSNVSRMIDLNIAIVRSKASKKLDDPVIMLAGGPGQAAVESYSSVAHAFKDIVKDRDVVLVDQRGTGKSNPLKCDFDEEELQKILEEPDLMIDEITKCVKTLDAAPQYYTTIESIKDLEEVRIALNIDKWNLIGISYGTRKALTYMKMFPEAIRSVILDGVVPQQEPLAESHEKNLLNALRKQFAQCAEQPDCKEAFGDVEEQMWALFDKFDDKKQVIRLQDPLSGEYDDVTLTRDFVALAIRMYAYSSSSMNLIPLIISEANEGQLETIASQASLISGMMQESMTNVELSILCAEDVPFYKQQTETAERTVFAKDFLSKTSKICKVWPHLIVDSSYKEPVQSDLPVLLLSGELDPVTPPTFAEIAMETLTNAEHLVAKGQGHNVFPLGCMPDIITAFIKDPEKELDTDCMSDFDYTPFFINMMGPKQ